jgi:hypothetical protein
MLASGTLVRVTHEGEAVALAQPCAGGLLSGPVQVERLRAPISPRLAVTVMLPFKLPAKRFCSRPKAFVRSFMPCLSR